MKAFVNVTCSPDVVIITILPNVPYEFVLPVTKLMVVELIIENDCTGVPTIFILAILAKDVPVNIPDVPPVVIPFEMFDETNVIVGK